MKYNFLILPLLLLVLNLYPAPPESKCFYLDKSKIDETLKPLIFSSTEKPTVLKLEESGVKIGNKLKCQWSLNGGSGTKEIFSFDGDVAVPILNPTCEKPFAHVNTGVGFGDWYWNSGNERARHAGFSALRSRKAGWWVNAGWSCPGGRLSGC